MRGRKERMQREKSIEKEKLKRSVLHFFVVHVEHVEVVLGLLQLGGEVLGRCGLDLGVPVGGLGGCGDLLLLRGKLGLQVGQLSGQLGGLAGGGVSWSL